jgi:hypothetical protein
VCAPLIGSRWGMERVEIEVDYRYQIIDNKKASLMGLGDAFFII